MEKPRIGIITFPIGKAGIIPTSNLMEILSSLSNDIYLLTGNEGYDFFKRDKRFHVYGINHKKEKNFLLRIIKYIYVQLKISYKIVKISKNIDLWIFFIGGDLLVLPILTAKLLEKKVVLALAGSSLEGFTSSNNYLSKLIKILENLNRLFSDLIILYSPNLIRQWKLEQYKHKILISDRHFLDFDIFKITKNIDERKNLVGYIGRLSKEKGILTFIEVIQIVAKKRDENIEFLIVGDGELNDKIIEFLNKNNLDNKVKVTGWISHEKLPDYLNELKLLVLPSYTEGLPNIILEAMACGTPVLATPVGSIPDIIKDDETGFIIKKSNPTEIAEKILCILNNPDLQRITENAKNLVEKQFNFEICVENYKKVLLEVLK